MILIIDAYNVLKSAAMRSSEVISEKQRAAFIKQLGQYGKKKGHKIIVVFDGGPTEWTYKERVHGVSVVYSGVQENADAYIMRYIKANREYDLLVVSSDRQINACADRHNVVSLDAHLFYDILRHEVIHKKNNGGITSGQSAVKTSGDDNPELDALMSEEVGAVPQKSNDDKDSRRVRSDRVAKSDKKMYKKIKKL